MLSLFTKVRGIWAIVARISWFPYSERIFKDIFSGTGIEIGGLNNPMTVVGNAKVLQVDYLSTEDLRRKFSEQGAVDIASVDVVADAHALDSAFSPGSLDFVIANHVIEHFEDPLRVLRQFHRILRVGGIVHLAVPDKRVTFDKGRPRTPITHLIEDNLKYESSERETRLFQHYQEWVEMVPPHLPVWSNVPKEHNDYLGNLEQLWADRYSIHLHVWEPDDWTEIINYLNQNGSPFKLLDYSYVFAPEDRNEFVLILRKETTPSSLLSDTLQEKGPIRWYVARCLRRALFINTINKFIAFISKNQSYVL